MDSVELIVTVGVTVFTQDPNLRFGVLALRRSLIDENQFVQVCAEWSENRRRSLAELLVDRGWLSQDQADEVSRMLGGELAAEQAGEHPTMTMRRHTPTVRDGLASLDLDLEHEDLDELVELDLAGLDLGDLPLTMRERITLRGLHSSGGIGEVWRAYDEVLGREVALKRLKQDQAEHADNRARFFREARITGQLDHPGVVPVYDYSSGEGHPNGHCFYTMRFLRGRTLAEVIADFHEHREAGEPFVGGELLELLGHFVSICNTIAFAHARGIVHRDLKGDNVIVGDYGEVIVLDWGLAKRVEKLTGQLAEQLEEGEAPEAPSAAESLIGMRITDTMQGERLGTPSFMAPEQALGHIDRIDHRTDVYGLSAILFDILTGHPPFTGEDVLAVMDAVARKDPPRPSELVPEVPRELEAICLRGLAKSRRQRWSSVKELAEAVRAWQRRLAERRRSEHERERFFDLSMDLLAIVDAGGHITQSNASWGSMLGWSEADRRGAELARFVHADDRHQLEDGLAKLDAHHHRVEFDLRFVHAKGDPCWIHVQARKLPDDTGLYLVGRDVTERRRSEQMFMGLLESAPDATCVINAGGTLTLVNAQLEQMFGYTREELLGQPVEILVPEALRGRHLGHVRRYVEDPKARPMGSNLELSGQAKDGTIIPIEVSLSPVETETGMLVSCALRTRS